MGTVKFFSPSGSFPTPNYLNYIGMLGGGYANQQGLDGTNGEIFVPLNNLSATTDPTNDKNVTFLDLSGSGQDVDFYIYGFIVSLANVGAVGGDGITYPFDLFLYIDGVQVETTREDVIDYANLRLTLSSPLKVNTKVSIGIVTECDYFDLVSCNTLFYCTGNIIPPTACEYFEKVSSTNGGSVLVVTSTPSGSFYQPPLVFQATNWQGGTAGNRVPRTRNWNTLSSDPSATTLQGQTYYVEATLSQAYGTNKKIYLYFGYDINDRTSSVGIPYIDGNLTTPQGFYLEWNPNSVADPLFMFIGESVTLANAYNGTITFKVGTADCPA
jgi:hypothetical protein